MYNSPLQYCKSCKQYVALDQSMDACRQHRNCAAPVCPIEDLFASANEASKQSSASVTNDEAATSPAAQVASPD
jgi:hypothetical protein